MAFSNAPGRSSPTGGAPFSAESYFATQPAPPGLDADVKAVRDFVAKQKAVGRRVVLVTSGGTTVPLELNVVRFLDNFSAGTRGATSAEYFLRAGYAVIFMHRQFSLQPFSRHYSHSTNPFLDFLELEDPRASISTSSTAHPSITTTITSSELPSDVDVSKPTPKQTIVVQSSNQDHLRSVLSAYKAVHRAGTLHTVTFVTVNEYLWLLRALSGELNVLGRRAMYYLAAAVSDFFLPREKMSEHKIQSGKGSLVIEMDQVPKILKPMVDEWTPDAFIVSFKLETDTTLLIPKARAALERYGHQVVIGNELHRRKFEVVFVARTQSPSSCVPPPAQIDGAPSGDSFDALDGVTSPQINETWLRLDEQAVADGKEIEEDIIAELVRMHKVWLNSGIQNST